MRFLWIDTETTGIETTDSAPFEVGMILVDQGKVVCERCFFLNPLSEKIVYHKDAGKIHGYSKEQIEAFEPEEKEVNLICAFFEDAKNLFKHDGSQTSKLYFAGYNCNFDYNHLKVQIGRYGFKMEDYFEPIKADVYEQVKKASKARVIPYLENRKLGTLCKHFNINLEDAHDALADIRATKSLAAKLHSLGIALL